MEERDRKAEHIRLALDARMQADGNHFDAYRFEHCALPEVDFDEIDTRCRFLGRELSAPLLISCMTGGTDDAERINRNLARAAEETGVAVGVGSQRKALEDPSRSGSFMIRPFAPTVPILGNLGAVQLNYGYGIRQCRAAVEMIDADALVLHLNPLQEAIQPEGQRNFATLLPKIGQIVSELEVPVIAKEVGCGISRVVAERLMRHGVEIVDTAGVGGTSWARIEAARAGDAEIGERFADWGIPTPEALRGLRGLTGLTVIGSGGVRNGVDAAKAIACGADLVGLAYRFLRAADQSKEKVVESIRRIVEELKISMFCVGARTIAELGQVELRHSRADGVR
ncbi:MAG TPA: type 2 isopentenyl-diphosphate Delta-isomerase [Candidatus Polarisedimenticolaceae bacterium]|nr:type 2 isopentenyl-diphosphate Delta-isomerase [Candidatus Polarisedimenticolaceae bacterium]